VSVMVSRSLRGERVPANVVLISSTSTVPCGYTLDCSYNGKYLKQIQTACTAPGTCVGATSHTHSSAGSHTHTPGSSAHTHNITTGADPSACFTPRANSGVTFPQKGHSHTVASGSASPTVTVGTCGSHTHNAQNNDPPYYEVKLMKKDSNISLRKQHVPYKLLMIWPKPLACIYPEHTLHTCGYGKNLKVVPTNCVTPGSTGGNATHTHGSCVHSHTVSLAAHTNHSMAVTGGVSSTASGNACAVSSSSICHTHAQGSGAMSNVGSCNSTDSPGHTHDAQSNIPASIDISLVSQDSISLRKSGIQKNIITLWTGALGCIPAKNQIADGTNCTVNHLDKYLLTIPNGCTNPGSGSGSNTHTHSCVAHSHANVVLNHAHALSGTTGGASGTQGDHNVASPYRSPSGHTHAWSGSSQNTGPSVTMASSGGHTHGSQCNKPSSKEIALIQRL